MGCEIRSHRKAAGLSQETLAKMIGSGQGYIHRAEVGKVSIGIGTLIKIADALDIEVRDLIPF